jgi:hypothetical protein
MYEETIKKVVDWKKIADFKPHCNFGGNIKNVKKKRVIAPMYMSNI